ncbi:radical SAM protein [Albimonas sp. CAU 1670]|uniref:radical SAM protein n=1 Tax=Albimonas sp. CAU 1670 TaxID=3032599 RepID=UPI0023DC4633|nr:radical SAM protein [Albimonas sp. CAU 1670]MDF2232848.1 radical SAM protein [Albimonas sp. CAU 1670]
MTSHHPVHPAAPRKFADPDVTAKGEPRASVALGRPRTLWFNTGTLCNIECAACYIESSPTNDRLVYLSTEEVERFLDEAQALGWPLEEAGFTGGEPFLNPQAPAMIEAALTRGLSVLVLTNAMRPMMRPSVQAALRRLIEAHGARLTFRVSLDHPEAGPHDAERGPGAFAAALEGLRWLRDAGARIAVAGRLWEGREPDLRARFAALFAAERLPIDAADPAACVLFPEMDEAAEPPEITTACWGILNKRPEEVMCASSRMVVRRKGSARASVAACTLLPYAEGFDMGETLAEASAPVKLNHRHCATFCVLGGASCSA